MPNSIDPRRIFPLNTKNIADGPIIYWMSRDQRVNDNWSILYAQQIAEEKKQELIVIFCLVPHFHEATIRQYGFMLNGLEEVEKELDKLQIPFHLIFGDPENEIARFSNKVNAGLVVTDFDPLKIKRKWQDGVARSVNCAMHEVDSHNIVPCRMASNKQEFGAYTIRPKIKKVLSEYLNSFPTLKKQKIAQYKKSKIDWQAARKSLKIDMSVPEVAWCISGEKAAKKVLKSFIESKIKKYDENRNDPNEDAQSNLSPYLHFGQISAQRVAIEAKNDAFLEELIIRRELSDNFCFYNQNYDSSDGFPAWAKKTLSEHAEDPREFIYTKKIFEEAKTHDTLWNAAQIQLTKTGKMHGYMRMYWAKKILEWTKSPSEAMEIAIYLNDKYELDGRDPNGYAGIAWSIGGVHDRAWFDRLIFGKIRYMSYNGCKSKFDVNAYCEKYR